jgi:hypothetical protein
VGGCTPKIILGKSRFEGDKKACRRCEVKISEMSLQYRAAEEQVSSYCDKQKIQILDLYLYFDDSLFKIENVAN